MFFLLLLSACDSENEANDVEFSVSYDNSDSSVANGPLDSSLNIVYSSRDSLKCEFVADVGCGQDDYVFRSILMNDSTLGLSYVNHSGKVCGGIFRTKVVLTAWSKEYDLRPITRIDFAGYRLSKK
ncbi:MAG: hypothetical protein JWO30_291 [Fibrobacteres bacterium]|nr:hypothetical protein [Fibrobacterota bacterium]